MGIGETNQFVWDYSKQSNILNIHRKGKDIAGSSELGDFTVDAKKFREFLASSKSETFVRF